MLSESFILKSFAKINIFLEITGKENGLHNLHSLFARINLFDEISVSQNNSFEVFYKNKTIENDIITKTVNILRNHFPQINANFKFNITKNIPVGAGLGGASSNSAEVLKFLISQNNIKIPKEDLLQIGKEIGADVPFFLSQGWQFLNGSSTELSPFLFNIPQLFAVVAFPRCELLTKDVFAKISPPYSPHNPISSFHDATSRNNDMQNAANEVTNSLIVKTLGKISNENAISTKMSGSGCACFSLFENEQFAQECYNSNKGDEEIQLFCVEVLML